MNRHRLIVLLGFLMLGFNNCAPFKAVNVDEIESASDPNHTTGTEKTCSLEQISSSILSFGSSLDFYLRSSVDFEKIEYNCNSANWTNLELTSTKNQFVSVPNIPAGKYDCSLRGFVKSQTISCSGKLQFEIAAEPFPPTTNYPPTPPPTWNPSAPSGNSSGFSSVHQLPKKIFKPDYTLYEPSFVGYKNQFNPNHPATGCALGVSQYSSQCSSPGSSNVFSISSEIVNGTYGYTQHGTYSEKQFKIFIPPGAFYGSGILYLPQRTRVALVAKLQSPPSRTSPLTMDEYRFNPDLNSSSWVLGSIAESDSYKLNHVDTGEGFEKLIRGEEFIIIHHGGGVMPLFPILRRDISKSALDKGYWIYIRILNSENDPVSPSFRYEVNPTTYQNWYNSATFGQDGDPI